MTRKISAFSPEKARTGPGQLLVDVEFGVPSRQCVNYGICRIELAGAPPRRKNGKCKQCSGWALASAPENSLLELAFLPDSISPQTRQQHFGRGYFLIEEAYALPVSLCSKLGIPAATIGCGQYRIVENGRLLIVRFSNLVTL